MLGSHKIMAFAPTLDANKARPFYEGILGLRVLSQDNFKASGLRRAAPKSPGSRIPTATSSASRNSRDPSRVPSTRTIEQRSGTTYTAQRHRQYRL